MKDPNENLLNSAYTKDDLIPVVNFSFGLTKAADKLIAQYELANGAKPKQIFDIKSKEKWRRAEWYQFLQQHVVNKVTVNKLYKCYDVHEAMKHAHEVRKPYQVTHRKNERGFDLIARKLFEE